jgi:hypothetical protein
LFLLVQVQLLVIEVNEEEICFVSLLMETFGVEKGTMDLDRGSTHVDEEGSFHTPNYALALRGRVASA